MDNILQKASAEQLKYINDIEKHDSKLIATAGSGKTFSIIMKICNIIKQNIFKPNEIYVLTFSRQARQDFVKKIINYKLDKLVCINNIKTIDSFAKNIIDPNNTIDRCILSYTLNEFLKNNTEKTLKKTDTLNDIKILFVDEAQDLNNTQYNIICLLKEKLKTIISLIGDPNQNIFQFRGGCDKYLVDYPTDNVYYLSTNFRSYKHIVEFSKHLQKYKQDVNWKSESNRENAKVTFYGYRNNDQYEAILIGLINKLKGKIPLHKIAILSPTKGYLSNVGKHKGLCYAANLLNEHNIPIQILYDETCDKILEGGRKFNIENDHVSLMTYTASKGLEWDYVILIDANAYLISKKNYTSEKFDQEKYLLYVATTRAKKGMYIFTKTNEGNSWFNHVDKNTFDVFDPQSFNILHENRLNFEDKDYNIDTNIGTLVNSLSEKDMYNMNELTDTSLKHTGIFLDTIIAKHIDTNKLKFIHKLFKLIFMIAYAQHHNMKIPKIKRIESLLHESNIIFCQSSFIVYWFESQKELGWENYNKLLQKNNVPEKVKLFIDENLSRGKNMDEYILINDKFYNTYILVNKDKISKHYSTYKNNKNVESILDTILYIACLDYAIETMHYFYIQNYKTMFGAFINENNKEHVLNIIESVQYFPKYMNNNVKCTLLNTWNGRIDYVDNDMKTVFIYFSTSNELKLQEKLYFLLHDYAYNNNENSETTVFNLATGVYHTIKGNINSSVINILQQNPNNSRNQAII